MKPRSKSSPKEARAETVDTLAAAFNRFASVPAMSCNDVSSSCSFENDLATDTIALHARSRAAIESPSFSSFCRRFPDESIRVLEISKALFLMLFSILSAMLCSRSNDAVADFRAFLARLCAAIHTSSSCPFTLSKEWLAEQMEYSKELSEGFCDVRISSSSDSILIPYSLSKDTFAEFRTSLTRSRVVDIKSHSFFSVIRSRDRVAELTATSAMSFATSSKSRNILWAFPSILASGATFVL